MQKNSLEKLTKLGFTQTEALIYLSLLSSNATASELSSKLGIGRTNLYPALRQLATEGLIKELPKSKGFRSEHPSRLRRRLAAESLRVQEKSLLLEALIPALESESRETEAVIRNFQGNDAWAQVEQLLFFKSGGAILHVRTARPNPDTLNLARDVRKRRIIFQSITPVTRENAGSYAAEERLYGTRNYFREALEDGHNLEVLLTKNHLIVKTDDAWKVATDSDLVTLYRSLIASLWNSLDSSQNALEKRWKRLGGN
jgi:DNA-binding MarR family transcriptional regulator